MPRVYRKTSKKAPLKKTHNSIHAPPLDDSDTSTSSGDSSYSTDSNDGGHYVIEALVDVKGTGKNKQFYVKWKDWDESTNTWEPASGIPSHFIKAYEQKKAKEKDNEKDDDEDQSPAPVVQVKRSRGRPRSKKSQPNPKPKAKPRRSLRTARSISTSSCSSSSESPSVPSPPPTTSQPRKPSPIIIDDDSTPSVTPNPKRQVGRRQQLGISTSTSAAVSEDEGSPYVQPPVVIDLDGETDAEGDVPMASASVPEVTDDHSSDGGSDDEYVVEAVVDSRASKKGRRRTEKGERCKEYFLKWQGWPSSANTWQHEDDCTCEKLIEEFEKKKKKKTKSDVRGNRKRSLENKDKAMPPAKRAKRTKPSEPTESYRDQFRKWYSNATLDEFKDLFDSVAQRESERELKRIAVQFRMNVDDPQD